MLTYIGKEPSKASLLDRWQFNDRRPRHVVGPVGLHGVIAEGPNRPETHKWARSVGYCYDQMWVQAASAGGSEESLHEHRALIETILASLIPRVDAGR